MILDAAEIMLFGMLGIFIVMGIIIITIVLLGKLANKNRQNK